jgi:hypothetical protein
VSFGDALGDYIASVNNPGASVTTIHAQGADTLLPFQAIPVYHKIKFTAIGSSRSEEPEIVDTIHARPEQVDSHGRTILSWFDTVLVRKGTQQNTDQMKGAFI